MKVFDERTHHFTKIASQGKSNFRKIDCYK